MKGQIGRSCDTGSSIREGTFIRVKGVGKKEVKSSDRFGHRTSKVEARMKHKC